MPQSYDFGPLFGSTVGFDRVFDLLQSATRSPQEGERFPPYDIERTGENAYRITLAVAGFREDELTITAERNLLFIEGEHKTEAPEGEREFLHRGIGARAFKQALRILLPRRSRSSCRHRRRASPNCSGILPDAGSFTPSALLNRNRCH